MPCGRLRAVHPDDPGCENIFHAAYRVCWQRDKKKYKTPLRHRRCPESPVRRHSQPGPYGSQQAEPADAEHDVPITQQPSRAGDSPRKENADIYELKRNYCNEWSDSETEETRETLHVDREPHSEPYDNHHAIFQNAVYQAFKELRDEKDEYRTVKKSPYKVRTNIYQNFLPLTPPPTPCGRQPQIGTSPTREPRCTKRRLLPSIVSLPSTSRQLPRTYLGTGYYEDYRAYPSTSSHVYHQRAPERIDRPWEIEREDWRVREYEEDRKVEEYYEERRIKEYAQRVNREDKVSTKGKLTKDGKIPKKGKAIREEKDRSRDSETREDRTPRKKPDLSKYTDDPDYFKGTGQRDFIANRVEWYLPINEALIKDIAQDVKTSRKRRVEKMNQIDEHERKIIIEFCHLLEKSKQLFNGLRELPQYGHKQWHAYFGRTFDVYTKLWKFQQQHRIILDTKYGLKRWQIGEIASKIGQLYYHFYLRTSETAYLNEAFSFYFAIRGRCYYTKANKEDKCELMVKKLRYYARFIVVCLLLRKLKVVRELIKELERQIVEYGATYDPDDQLEWALVVDEVKAFLQAEPVVNIMNSENQPIVLSHRIAAHDIPPVERSPHMTLYLQEAVIVGSTSKQVKFSEMTMDMFRMLHALEREPSDSQQHLFDESPRQRFLSTPNVPHAKGYIENGPVCDNPHKNLLYKPSPMTVLTYLASGCQDLPPNAAMLLYISADGQISQGRNYDEGYDPVYNSMKNDAYRIDRDGIREGRGPESKPGPAPKHKEMQCLHPGDLFPFTRHPFFMIVDSDNSHVFQNVPRQFGQPLIVLMSPLELPPPFHDRRNQGSLFTMFLTMPQQGLCAICDEINGDERYWFRGDELLNAFMAEASAIFTRTKSVDMQFIAFFGDDYLRLMTLRFIFCEISLRLHRSFRSRNNLTRSSPPLPEEIFENPTLIHIVLSLATHYQIRGHFHDPTAGPAAKE